MTDAVRAILEERFPGAHIIRDAEVAYDGLIADDGGMTPDELEAVADFAVKLDWGHLLLMLPGRAADDLIALGQVAENHANIELLTDATEASLEEARPRLEELARRRRQ